MANTIKIDLDKSEETKLLNSAEIARLAGISRQYAGRILKQKQPGKKVKEHIVKLHGSKSRAA